MPDAPRFYYYRDHADSGAWGVRDDGRIVATGLDKSIAAAMACLLNGDVAGARSLLRWLPTEIVSAKGSYRTE